MIEEYRFGSIIIDGKEYHHDVEVRWTGEVLKWWRLEGHSVVIEDLEMALEANPEVIVIGTGAQGRMEVPEDIREAVRIRGIQLVVDPTEEATKTFNIINEESQEEEGRQKRIIGLFHLTC
jgi:hypothetical protein